jgi:YLP motif-containing protein 1
MLQEAPTYNVADLMRRPGRLKRPERICIVLRGLPGAGKSRVARTLRDIEVANGGEAPRVLSIDDYFMQETDVMKK